jgi:hypothetical protein
VTFSVIYDEPCWKFITACYPSLSFSLIPRALHYDSGRPILPRFWGCTKLLPRLPTLRSSTSGYLFETGHAGFPPTKIQISPNSRLLPNSKFSQWFRSVLSQNPKPWYCLSRRLPSGAVLRLVADQGVFAPAFIGVFFSALFLLEVSASLSSPFLASLQPQPLILHATVVPN